MEMRGLSEEEKYQTEVTGSDDFPRSFFMRNINVARKKFESQQVAIT